MNESNREVDAHETLSQNFFTQRNFLLPSRESITRVSVRVCAR